MKQKMRWKLIERDGQTKREKKKQEKKAYEMKPILFFKRNESKK